MRYQAVVTRNGRNWLVDVPELEGTHTFARNLVDLELYTREVILLGADLPDEEFDSIEFDMVFRTGNQELDRELAEARHRRSELEKLKLEVQKKEKLLAKKLNKRGWTVRDIGYLLGISAQRVSQLSSKR